MDPNNSIELISGCRDGDEDAAREVFLRYVSQLVSIAQRRMSAKITKRVDPEDIVQSAFRTFFRHAKAGRYEIEGGNELWHLLTGITMNKVRQAVEYHSAQRRHVDNEQPAAVKNDSSTAFRLEGLSRDPSPDEAALITDEIDALTHDMDEEKRRMVELRLQGYHIEEIATAVSRAERTVRRTLKTVRERLEQRFEESASQ